MPGSSRLFLVARATRNATFCGDDGTCTVGARENKQTLERQVRANALLINIAKIAVVDVIENGDGAGNSDGDSNVC